MTTPVDIFSEFAISETKSQEGVWVPYKDGVEFLIAKSGNKKFRRLAASMMNKNKRILDQKDGDGVSTEAAEAKLNEIMGEYFTQPFPARAAVQAAALPKGALVEADAVMVLAA